MTYRFAKTLHNGDEVIRKDNKRSLYVVSITVMPKTVLILCDDGNEYHHRNLK